MLAGVALLGLVPSAPFPARAQDTVPAVAVPERLFVFVGKSVLVESAVPIERVSVGFGEIAEAAAVTDREVLLNGRAPGETSLIIWQRGGGKLFFDVTVGASDLAANSRVDAVGRELKLELPGQNVEINYENSTVFLRGRVKDLVSAERAVSIASTLGRTVNLLYVDVPPLEPQILLKVRFASVDRSASLQLGLNIVSTGAGNTIGAVSTQQFSSPQINTGTTGPPITLSDALNIFLFRPDLNLLAAIQALQQNSLLEILAEPDVLAMNGRSASFLAGGEFPFPSFQPSATGIGTVTVTFREYGIRLNFTPTITPRGTIQLQVAPEVSALDFTNGLVVQGYTIPALTVRKVNTEIELAAGQSFAIAGLIDDQFTETLSKIPGLGDLPILGKLFQSKTRTKSNTELLVIVTPELVSPPATANQPAPEMKFPQSLVWPRAASKEEITPVPPKANAGEGIPVETLMKSLAPDIPVKPPPVAAIPQPPGPIQTVPPVPPPN
jgi:pilus assembly protein CpaC